jgi:hypothetical protein
MDSSAVPNHFRLGTWNVEGRADPGAVALLLGLGADVLLLTEVHPALSLPRFQVTKPAAPLQRARGVKHAGGPARRGCRGA